MNIINVKMLMLLRSKLPQVSYSQEWQEYVEGEKFPRVVEFYKSLTNPEFFRALLVRPMLDIKFFPSLCKKKTIKHRVHLSQQYRGMKILIFIKKSEYLIY